MYLLRNVLLPRIHHGLVLGRATTQKLKNLDLEVRKYVKKWLRLPHDTTKSFIHTQIKAGGLGIPSMQYTIPLMKYNRIDKMTQSNNDKMIAICDSKSIQNILYKTKQTLSIVGPRPTKEKLNKYWQSTLYTKTDGKDLRDISNHKSSMEWSRDYRGHTTGEDYIHYNQIRNNSVPTKVRSARGKSGWSLLCRAGCQQTETLHHVIQACHRTHGGRILRHNRIVDILADELRLKGFSVETEPRLTTPIGLRKPDLVMTKNNIAEILDVQCVKPSNLENSHDIKIHKYMDIPNFDTIIKTKYNTNTVHYNTCTVSYKGTWSKQSIENLQNIGVTNYCLHKIVTSVLRGSWLNWRRFNKLTTVRPH